MNFWGSTFVPWQADYDVTYWGAIDAHEADSVIIENNFVSGAQRTGILYKGDLCPGVTQLQPGMNHSVKNNIIHSSLAGAAIFPGYTYSPLISCASMTGFTVFKSVNYGLYYQNAPKVILDSNVLVDNQVGLFAIVIEPNEISHAVENKTIHITNTIIVGRSSSFNCTSDLKPNDLNNKKALGMRTFGSGANGLGMTGLAIGNFLGETNKMPKKPWYKPKNVQTF